MDAVIVLRSITKPNNPSFRINRSVGNNYTSTTGEILPWNVVEWDKTNVTGYLGRGGA